MKKKTIFMLLLLPLPIAFAGNPKRCITPDNLRAAAMQGIVHSTEEIESCKKIVLNQWYNVGYTRDFKRDMILLKEKGAQWQEASGAANGKGVYCAYTNQDGAFVALWLITSHKVCPTQKYGLLRYEQ